MTYRNRIRSVKTFAVGDVVLRRQTQVSVGPHSAIKPKFSGPYHIDSIRPQQMSADIVHYRTGRTLHCHFSELQKLYHDQQYARLPESFDSTMLELLPDKYSRARYLASQPFDTQQPTQSQRPPRSDDEDSQHSNQSDDDDGFDFPDDAPLYDLSHIDISNVDQNTVLDLSHINLEDYRVDRSTQQRKSDSQVERELRAEDEEIFGPDDDPLNPDDDNDGDGITQFGNSQLPTHSRISTDDVEVTIIRDPVANFTITEYKNIDHPMCVHVENLDPTQRVTELQVDPSVRPIQVKVITEPVDGMIEDIPALQAPKRPVRRPRRVAQDTSDQSDDDNNPYKKKYKSYSKPSTSSRYNTRSKNPPSQANNTVIFYFKPP